MSAPLSWLLIKHFGKPDILHTKCIFFSVNVSFSQILMKFRTSCAVDSIQIKEVSVLIVKYPCWFEVVILYRNLKGYIFFIF